VVTRFTDPQPNLDRLRSQLLTTGLQNKDNPLWQVIDQLIAATKVIQSKINTSIASSAAIITSASFLMVNDETVTFPNSKQTNLTGFTSGSVIFSDGASLLAEDNVNFFWDNPNNRLGLKTNVPTVTFDLFESGLITTTTIGHRLHNSTAATLAVPKQISPGLEWSANAWDTNDLVNRSVRVALYNKPSSDSVPFPGFYFATNIAGSWVDQLLFGSIDGDVGQFAWRMGTGVNIIFSSNRGILWIPNGMTDVSSSSCSIIGNAATNRITIDTVNDFVYIEGNNTGFGPGVNPMLQIRGIDQSSATPVVNIRHRGLSFGAPAAGFGIRQLIQLQSSTTVDQDAGAFDIVWTDVTHATRTAAIDIYLVNSAAALARIYRFLATGEFQTLAGGLLTFTGRSKISSPADSDLLLTNNAGDNFDMLLFGGTSSSFPALKRNAAVLETKLADDSAYAQHRALEYMMGRADFLMRNSVAWNDGAGANVGTLNNAPTAGDPTKWIPIDDNGTTRYIPTWT